MAEADPTTPMKTLPPTVEMTVEERLLFREAVARGLAQGEAGEVVPGDEVFRWIESWGTDHELPPPALGRAR